VLDDLPAPSQAEMEGAGLGWMLEEFPWAHGRTIITTRAAEWVREEQDSWEVSAAEQRRCDQCRRCGLSGTMQKCGRCRLVYYCSVDCQTAAWGKHKDVCVPRRSVAAVTGLSVGSFGEDEACAWILSTVRQWRGDDAGVLELVQYLGCLPLAVGQVSAFASTHKTPTAGEYLAELKRTAPAAAVEEEELKKGARVQLHSLNKAEHNGKKGELLEYDAVAGRWGVKLSLGERLSVRPANLAVMSRGDECPPSLCAVVKLSMGAIRESKDGSGKAAEEAIRKMALCDTTGIPLELLSRAEKEAVGLLTQHAMVTKDDKGLVTMHALTQRAVRGLTDTPSRGELVAAVAGALRAKLFKFDDKKPATYFIGRRYAAHASAAAAHAGAWGLLGDGPRCGAAGGEGGQAAGGGGVGQGGAMLLEEVFWMCSQAGCFFWRVGGQYVQALSTYKIAQDCGLVLHGPEDPLVAYCHMQIGNVYRELCKFDEALFHLGRAQKVFTATLGCEDPEYASAHNSLGAVHLHLGNGEKALFHFRKAHEVYVCAYGDRHLDTAQTEMNIGNVYGQLSRHEEALFHLGKAQKVFVAILGHESLDVAQTYCNMGCVYSRQGLFEKALEFYQKDLEITVNILGQDCPQVADTRSNIAGIYAHLGRHEEALEEDSKALDIRVSAFGRDNPLVAKTNKSIADVYHQQGRFEDALVQYRKAQEVFVTAYGVEHEDMARTDKGLGDVYKSLENYEKALFHYSRAQQVFVANLGDCRDVATTHKNMGSCYEKLSRFEDARFHHGKALEVFSAIHGDGHVDVASANIDLAQIYQKLGDDKKEIFHLARAQELFAEILGDDDVSHVSLMTYLKGRVHQSEGRYAEALEAYSKSFSCSNSSGL